MKEDGVQKIKTLYQSGFSIAEISKETKMSASGVAYHLKKENVSMRTRSEAVRVSHHKKLESHGATFVEKIPKQHQELYLVGISLYWGEGSKTGNTVAIANSDAGIITMFLTFLRVLCNIDEKRLHVLIHRHPDEKEEDLVRYWSSLMKIKKSQFYKSTVHKEGKKNSTKRIKFGTISLRYSDSQLLQEILERIKDLPKIVNKPL